MGINLLPWRQSQRNLQYQHLKYRITLFIILLLTLSVGVKLFFYLDIKHIYTKINQLDHQLSRITLTDPFHKNKTLLQKLIYFHAQQKTVKKTNTMIQNVLFDIANAIPHSIILSQLAINAKKISLSGSGNQLADIHDYVSALQTEKIGKKIELTDIQADKNNHSTMQFVINITQ